MFDFLKNKKEEKNNSAEEQEWVKELKETQQRWFVFLDKMEAKMEELCTAAIPELKEMLASDDDQFKRTFHKVQSGINGQLENIRKKVYDFKNEKRRIKFSKTLYVFLFVQSCQAQIIECASFSIFFHTKP